MAVTIEGRRPTPAEYGELRASVGWVVPPDGVIARALETTTAAVVASSDGMAIGMGRVVGDGALYSLLVDLVVHPDHQRRGVGAQILEALEAMVASVGGRGVLNVVAAPDVAGYYLRLGYEDAGDRFLQRSV